MTNAVPLYQHWNDIYRRRGWILLVVGMAAALGYLASQAITPVYEAKTTFYLAENAGPQALTSGTPDAQVPKVWLPTPEEKASSLSIGILRSGEMIRRLAAENPGTDVATLTKAIDFVVSNEFMIDVFVRNRDPELAARIANRVPELYEEFHEASLRGQALRSEKALDGWIGQLESDLATARQAHARRVSELGADSADRLLADQVTRRDALVDQIRQQSIEIRQAETERTAIAQALAAERSLYREGESVLNSTVLERLKAQLADVRGRMAELTEGPEGPRRLGMQGEIAEIERSIAAETDRLRTAISKPETSIHEALRRDLMERSAHLDSLRAGSAAMQQDLDAVDATLSASGAGSSELADLEMRIRQMEADLSAAQVNRAEAALQSRNAVPPLVTVERARVPEQPVFPLPVLNAIVAGVTGLVLGVYVALIFAYVGRLRQRRITEAVEGVRLEDFERELLAKAARSGQAS